MQLTASAFGIAANNGPNPRLLNIAQQIQKCGQFSNVGNQIAQGVNSGRISVGNVPSNAVATTNGWFNATSVIAPDALDDPSTVIHEWISRRGRLCSTARFARGNLPKNQNMNGKTSLAAHFFVTAGVTC